MGDAGRFIVLEGADGVGKSTQVALLSEWMDGLGLPHVVAREPGGTPVGEAIRGVVLSRSDIGIPPAAELLLILAARAALVTDVLRPALAEGVAVIADRFSLSTLAYQGYGRGLDLELIRSGLEIATGGLQPDLCLVLDLPLDEVLARRTRDSAVLDRIEREGEGFRRAVRDGYLALAEVEAAVEVVDALGSAQEVHERLRDRILARLPGTFVEAAAGLDDLTSRG